ncbi:MAG: hypothetical protein RIB93_28995 [Coleofasciculus sp. D1-CHI-01]|uniref:hypothetical protein n=1 Tax=Coleofasciculus sp. D1-CHI-01 TaxID=3068482 RepID=UPI0032F985D5
MKVEKGGFCRNIIGFSVNFSPKPAPTMGCCISDRMGKGGFCRNVISFSVNFSPKPAPTWDFMPRYPIDILTENRTKNPLDFPARSHFI